MGALNKDILAELQRQNQLIADLMGASAAPSPAEPPPSADEPQPGMMTDYDCLVICMSDDVEAAIDRWNKSRPSARRRSTLRKAA